LPHIGILKPDKLVYVLNWTGIPLIFIYTISMFVYPWIDSSLEWRQVQSVWHNWQSLNVGMLAFSSSVVVFNMARFNANKQREREFVAAKAFLPAALSELSHYFEASASALIEGWHQAKEHKYKQQLKGVCPLISGSYKEVFKDCINHAEPDVAEYLASILRQLQIHQSRLHSMYKEFSPDSTMITQSLNIESYMFSLAKLQALVNELFNYARGTAEFKGSSLTLDSYKTAYSNLQIEVENFDDLWGFTTRVYSRL
jgi:hypothetical protein